MTHSWEHWDGVSLPGNYTLEHCLGGDDSAAFFQTSIARDGRRAVVKLVPEANAGGAGPLDLWNRTHQLRHPNLVELLDCGRADRDGEIVHYAVFESPDETLASALSRSPLDPMESREVLDSVLSALRYLHAQGLVLGQLDPERIVAVGDRIKLSTDALREADTSSAYREDVRLLGELWRQALMPASAQSSEIAARAADPNPEARWTLAEISATLEPLLPVEPPPVSPPIVSSTIPEPPPTVSPVSAPEAAVPDSAPVLPPPRERVRERAVPYRFPRWIFVGAAGFLFLILILNWRRPADATAQSPVAAVSLPVEPPVPAAPAPAPLPKAAEPKPTVQAPPKTSPAAGKEMWRVIAFTYGTRDAAARKVRQINEDHPSLNASVFFPNEKGGYYLVSIGGRMTHEEAVRLQRTVRGKGLPRDLYVQNYSR